MHRAGRRAHGSGARCDPGRRGRGASGRRVVAACVALALLAAGVLVTPGMVALGPVLIAVGAVVLLVACWPLAGQVEVAAPLLGKVVLDPDRRRTQTRGLVEDLRELVVASAQFLCPDGRSARRAAEASLSEAVAYWRGADDRSFQVYVLCVLVHQARFETATSGAPAPPGHPAHTLSRQEREVLLLVDRAGLDTSAVAAMLQSTEDDVRHHHARALAALDARGGRA